MQRGAAKRKKKIQSLCVLSDRIQLFVALWTIARRAPLSTGSSRPEYWSRVDCALLRGTFPTPGIEPESLTSPALASRTFTTSATWEAQQVFLWWSHHHPKQTLCKLEIPGTRFPISDQSTGRKCYYQGGTESASGSAAWPPTAGWACRAGDRTSAWGRCFQCPRAPRASGPGCSQTWTGRGRLWWARAGQRVGCEDDLTNPEAVPAQLGAHTCLHSVSSLCLFLFFRSILVKDGLKSESSKSAQSSESFVDLETRPHLLLLFGLISPFLCSRPVRIFCVYKGVGGGVGRRSNTWH